MAARRKMVEAEWIGSVDALREEEDVECTWKRNGTDRGRRLANDMGGARKPCRDAMVLNLCWGVGCVISGGRIFPRILIVCCGRNEEGEFTSIIFLFL